MTNLQTSASVIRTNAVSKASRAMSFTALAAILVIAFGISSAANANTFRWASQSDIATLDPQASSNGFTHQFNGQIYEQLLSYDRNMKLVPSLATSWKQTSATTWVFTMREGVKFHDGAPLLVEDIIYSIERAGLPTSMQKKYGATTGPRAQN